MTEPRSPISRASTEPPVRVFAVESECAQLDWGRLPAGRLTVEIPNSAPLDREVCEGPGTLEIVGLQPDSDVELRVRHSGGLDFALALRTLPAMPGEEITRIATISDLHVGTTGFDYKNRLRDDNLEDPHPLRCARPAISEAAGWGAKHLVIKGDMTENNFEVEWQLVGELIRSSPIPVLAMPGNHDGYMPAGHTDPDEAAERAGFDLRRGVSKIDFGPVSLLLVDTTHPGKGRGRIAHLAQDVFDAAADTDRGALVFQHHQIQPVPVYWPPGINSLEGFPYLRNLARAQRNTFLSSGHTHRNRRNPHKVLTITEVGSVKDYPGVWGGYVIHERGIRQVLRRVSAQDAINWTERTGDALMGAWRLWSRGVLSDRSVEVRF